MNKFMVWFGLACGNFVYAYFMSSNFTQAVSWTVAQAVAIGVVALVNA
jgi:hypothetical protein